MVRLFEAFATRMKVNVGGLSAEWRAERGDQGGKIIMEVATDLEAEAVGLAEEIGRRRSQGIAYRDQAILCRSHNNLARFASRLEAQGIPVLYLGDLFERPEVRDMLALISLTCEPKRGGLLRVASFPEYNVPLEDARAVLTFAASENIYPLQAMTRLDKITGPYRNWPPRVGIARVSFDICTTRNPCGGFTIRISPHAKQVSGHRTCG